VKAVINITHRPCPAKNYAIRKTPKKNLFLNNGRDYIKKGRRFKVYSPN